MPSQSLHARRTPLVALINIKTIWAERSLVDSGEEVRDHINFAHHGQYNFTIVGCNPRRQNPFG
jgi:hypothetical protein